MITRAITENGPIDHNKDEIRSNRSMATGKKISQKSQQNNSSGFYSHTKTTSVIFNLKLNNTEGTETKCPTEVTGISNPTSFTLITGFIIQLQVPTKTIRSSSEIDIDPNTSENFTSQDNSFVAASHQFPVQTTETLSFSRSKGIQENIPTYNPFTDCMNQIQNNQVVKNQPNRSNDQTFMLNPITKSVPNLSRPPLAPPIIADSYSVNGTNENLLPTKSTLNATANPIQTLYQPHAAPSATLLS